MMDEVKVDQKYMLYISEKTTQDSDAKENTSTNSCCIVADLTGGYELSIIKKMMTFEELFYNGFNGSVYILINDRISYIKSNEARVIFDTIHYMKRNTFDHDFNITFLDSTKSTGISILSSYKKYIYYNIDSDIMIDEILRDHPKIVITENIDSESATSVTRAE